MCITLKILCTIIFIFDNNFFLSLPHEIVRFSRSDASKLARIWPIFFFIFFFDTNIVIFACMRQRYPRRFSRTMQSSIIVHFDISLMATISWRIKKTKGLVHLRNFCFCRFLYSHVIGIQEINRLACCNSLFIRIFVSSQ